MLTGILTKPANIDKGQDNIMTLDRDALLADVVANKDSYFHQLSRWSQVLITYESSTGSQLNHLEFDPTTGAFPTANFNPSARARNTWLVQSVMIRDLDDGEVIYYRDEVDTAHFDITLDQIAPTLTFVGISSNNTNSAIANPNTGDIITINFNSDEALQNVSATIAGQTASISGSGTSWSASYTLVGGESSGLVNFSINYEDLAGNQGTQVTSTTNGSSVTIQYLVPDIVLLQIQSDNTTLGSSKAVTGDTVTVLFNSDGPIDNINMIINGGAVVPTNIGLYQYQATYDVTAGSPDGNVSFTINYTDNNNNPGTTQTQNDTTDNSFVEIDNTAPQLTPVTITSTGGSTANADDIITLTFTANETINTPTVTILGNTVTATNTSGNTWSANYTVLDTDPEGIVPFTIDFEDDHKNQGTQVTSTTNGSSVTIQYVVPNINLLQISSNNATLGPSKAVTGDTVTVTFNFDGPIDNINMVINGGAVVPSNVGLYQYEATYSVTAGSPDGNVSFIISYTDLYNNPGVAVTQNDTTDNSFVEIDNTAPQLSFVGITSTGGSTANSSDTITLTFTANEVINTPTVTILGNSVSTTNISGNTWRSQYNILPTTPEGVVTFTIDFQDDHLNPGTQVTSTTNGSSVNVQQVVDVINIITIASDNANDTSKAVLGDLIKVSFTSTEVIQNVNVNIIGQSASVVNTSGNNWEASVSVLNDNFQGNATFSINYQNSQGQTGQQETNTTNGSFVNIDTISPTLDIVTISSNNTDNSIAETGDIITLNFTSDENITTPSVSILGNNVTATNIGGNNWQVQYTVVGTEPEGVVTFTIDFEDDHLNSGTQVTSTTDGSFVTIDLPITVTEVDVYTGLTGFGTSADIDGNYIVIGHHEYGGNVGRVYLFEIQNESLTLLQTIESPQQVINFYFGYSVSISGNLMAVSAPGDNSNSGTIFMYEIVGGSAQFKGTVTGSAFTGDFAGYSMDMEGNYTVTGSIYRDGFSNTSNNGGGYLHYFSPPSFPSSLDSIVPPTQSVNYGFGQSISISGNYVVVGASYDIVGSTVSDNTVGQAYLFKIDTINDTINHITTLSNPNPNDFDRFGSSVSIDGVDIVVGAPGEGGSTGTITDAGKAYYYKLDTLTDTVSQPVNIIDPNEAQYQGFGADVDVSNGNIIIGTDYFLSSGIPTDNVGKAYVYETLNGSIKNGVTQLDPIPQVANGRFGAVVGIYNNYAIVTNKVSDGNVGKLYLYKIT